MQTTRIPSPFNFFDASKTRDSPDAFAALLDTASELAGLKTSDSSKAKFVAAYPKMVEWAMQSEANKIVATYAPIAMFVHAGLLKESDFKVPLPEAIRRCARATLTSLQKALIARGVAGSEVDLVIERSRRAIEAAGVDLQDVKS